MIRDPRYLWGAALVLWLGVIGATGVLPQRRRSLEAPLGSVVPIVMEDYVGSDVEVSEEEARVAGFSDYLFRSYSLEADPSEETTGLEPPIDAAPDEDVRADSAAGTEEGPPPPPPVFTVYVGYYDGQTKGKTIHSPKNCLPGSGWEALGATKASVETAEGPVTVNRYLLQNGDDRALVLYWYQGRGRVQANEYVVKWDLLRDAALHRRSDEALVRIVVPMVGAEDDVIGLARSVAAELVPALNQALPD